MKNIHIAYGDSARDCLLLAREKYGLDGDGVISARDDFTQGPIFECTTPNGLKQRIAYWEDVDRILEFGFDVRKFYNRSIKILDELETDEVTIWVGDSCHDILATGWLILYLKAKNIKWFIVNLAKIGSHDLPEELPAVNLAMYVPEAMVDLYKYRKPLDSADVAYFSNTWKQVAAENSHYRIQKKDQIISVDEDYYDGYILSHICQEFEPTRKVIGRILKEGGHRISDTTVEWNIRKLIDRELILFEGTLNSMNTYSIKRK